ncbi:helix-turn-helix transcriptional regulator [Enterovirga rhinocerotis]|uniref:PAS domain-containing protein n=1 Tax=Enterovirga rhinocerotis TaxID=1339210 RepID=A0A4R7BXJ6_9HYPH|nr:PAS domain-containing protein [Enterovirga rhinocerotis]TDR90233.1 PAS domain-containing protein [Enterovirga rhinocerotis]
MSDTERDIADCVGAVYEAATGGGDWRPAGTRICRLLDAQSATFRLGDGAGASRNVLSTSDDAEAAYIAYYHHVNPFMQVARRVFRRSREQTVGRVRRGEQVVPDADFMASEYYHDFARHHGRRHMISGMVGLGEATPLAFFRADGTEPFGERDVRVLQMLMPHVQRAVELRARLSLDRQSAGLTRAVLDTVPFGIAVVDAGLRIRFVNDSGARHLAGVDAGLHAMRSGPFAGTGVHLRATGRSGSATLRALVSSAVSGGPGGSMRVLSEDGSALAVLVSPAPHLLAAEIGSERLGNGPEPLALIVIRPLDRKDAPSIPMLCDLFGFSRAEAEVAVALFGGAGAEDVARGRGVSLVTVRNQIRSILVKSGAANLRDLERMMATIAASALQVR